MTARAVLLWAMAGATAVCGADADAVRMFREGNAAYAATNFADAVAQYQKALDCGFQPGGLFYNLGNAYYRSGQVGRAIACYRRAQRLLPRDSDVVENLETARAQTVDHLAVQEVPGAVRAFLCIYYYLSPDECLWALNFFLLAFFAALSVWYFAPAAGLKRLAIVLGLCVAALGAAGGVHLYVGHAGAEAVVLADNVPGRSGPAESATQLFVLNSGTEVAVAGREGAWVKVAVADKKGWVPASLLEVL